MNLFAILAAYHADFICDVCGYDHADCYCADGDAVIYIDELECETDREKLN